jgi:aminoglycoside phosphotransferase family enzyme
MHMPDIEAKLKFLQAPQTYGESGLHLECIETHMSWVFLAGEQVFKLKKPVCFPFLDFTTLKAREFYCREEVRLNARMAPGIYLGVVALQWCDGAFSLVPETRLPAPGETVDWLVLMRRLPFRRMLDHLIANQQATPQDIDSLVERLGSFYRVAPTAPLAESDYLARFQCALASNREVLLRPQFKLENAALAIDRLGAALALASDLLRERLSRRRILDGHGDLRPEHVCLLQPPVVFDCLEFDPLLRQVDPFDEIAFLGMECDMAGAPWIGPQLVSGVARALGDHPHEALMYFYTAHRALLRARLAMAHLLDPKPRLPQKWPPLAERYIARALSQTDDFIAAMRNGTPG